MADEATLIPYRAGDLLGERLLVVAPHPDDEVLGCGGLIAMHTAGKRRVRVVVVTDGSASGEAEVRRQETRNGLSILGAEEVAFLDFGDRTLETSGQALETALAAELASFLPDVIAVPNPLEVHPDHLAVSAAIFAILNARRDLVPGDARVAFYEVSHAIRPNTLVDISAHADRKHAAIAAHASQAEARNYEAFVRGINHYRTMTLPAGTKAAEAYWVTTANDLWLTSWRELRHTVAGLPHAEVTREMPSISVVIRTYNRPALLQEAVESVLANDYPAEIVVVNDAGAPVDVSLAGPRAKVVNLPSHSGMSATMNAGVAAASGTHIAALDDDDLYFPDHLRCLARASTEGMHRGYYSDAVYTRYQTGPDGSYQVVHRGRPHAQDFDLSLLEIDNYIPNATLLIRKDHFLEAGGYSPEVDLFDDWDFLLRLVRGGPLRRIPQVTVEVRQFPDHGSSLINRPADSEAFRAAKAQVWRRNGVLDRPESIARGLEVYKRRLAATAEESASQRDSRMRLRRHLEKMVREMAVAAEAVSHELAAHPRRNARVQELLVGVIDRYRAVNQELLEREAIEHAAPGTLAVSSAPASERDTEELKRELAALRLELDDIHGSTLWRVGSFYWRFLHMLGLIRTTARPRRSS